LTVGDIDTSLTSSIVSKFYGVSRTCQSVFIKSCFTRPLCMIRQRACS